MCLYNSQGFFFPSKCHSGGLVCLRGRVKLGLDKRSEKGHRAATYMCVHTIHAYICDDTHDEETR